MKLLNAEIQDFIKFLMNEELSAKQSRIVSRFIRFCNDRINEIEKERTKLVDKYAKKNDDGNYVISKNEKGENVYELNDSVMFNRELKELMLEEFIIDETNERKDMLLTIKDIVLNSQQKFKGQKALQYDRFCEIVENIEYKED